MPVQSAERELIAREDARMILGPVDNVMGYASAVSQAIKRDPDGDVAALLTARDGAWLDSYAASRGFPAGVETDQAKTSALNMAVETAGASGNVKRAAAAEVLSSVDAAEQAATIADQTRSALSP